MSMQFVYGRSGTGKSQYIYNQINERIDHCSKIFIITPEQFSFTAEKKLIEATSGSAIKAEVLSFERMAYRIFGEVSGAIDINLSDSIKSMIIYHLLNANKNKLEFMENSEDNVELVARQITELKKHNVKKEAIAEVITKLDHNLYLKKKLQDILILYEAFEQWIENKYVDTDDILTLLAKKIEKSEVLKDSILYIDEFAGFTNQEYVVIQELLKVAKEVVITICTDKLEKENRDQDIFYFNKETIEKLVKCCNKVKVKIEKPICLKETFRLKTEELKHLEANLYHIDYSKYNRDVQHISLFLASNPYLEIEYVAKEITKLVRDNGYRYKDISIITKEIGMYASNIKAIFHQYEIPVFIDENKDLNSNSFIKYIISILDIFSNYWSYESMFHYIKSGFLTIKQEDIYALEKYCVKYGIKGSKWYKEDFKIAVEEDLEYLNALRQQIVEPLLKLKENLQGIKTYKQISKEIYLFLTEHHIYEIVDNKQQKLEENKNLEAASEISRSSEHCNIIIRRNSRCVWR